MKFKNDTNKNALQALIGRIITFFPLDRTFSTGRYLQLQPGNGLQAFLRTAVAEYASTHTRLFYRGGYKTRRTQPKVYFSL